MSEKYYWNTDPDGTFDGPFDSLEEALEEASYRAFEDERFEGKTVAEVYVSQPVKYDFNKLAKEFLDSWIENVSEWAYDEGEEYSEDYTQDLDLSDLIEPLAAALKNNHDLNCHWISGVSTKHVVKNGWVTKGAKNE